MLFSRVNDPSLIAGVMKFNNKVMWSETGASLKTPLNLLHLEKDQG